MAKRDRTEQRKSLKGKGDDMEDLSLTSKEGRRFLFNVKDTCLDPDFKDQFWSVHSVQPIRNRTLENRYEDKRKAELEKMGNKEYQLQEVFVFTVEPPKVCRDIARDGYKVGMRRKHVLGHAASGVHLIRHYDILTRYMAHLFFTGTQTIMVSKAFFGKAKAVEPIVLHDDDEYNSPDTDYDCHCSSKRTLPSMTIGDALHCSYIYFYEFETVSSKPVKYPRQILPYAMLTLKNKPSAQRIEFMLAVDTSDTNPGREVFGETRHGYRFKYNTPQHKSNGSRRETIDRLKQDDCKPKKQLQKFQNRCTQEQVTSSEKTASLTNVAKDPYNKGLVPNENSVNHADAKSTSNAVFSEIEVSNEMDLKKTDEDGNVEKCEYSDIRVNGKIYCVSSATLRRNTSLNHVSTASCRNMCRNPYSLHADSRSGVTDRHKRCSPRNMMNVSLQEIRKGTRHYLPMLYRPFVLLDDVNRVDKHMMSRMCNVSDGHNRKQDVGTQSDPKLNDTVVDYPETLKCVSDGPSESRRSNNPVTRATNRPGLPPFENVPVAHPETNRAEMSNRSSIDSKSNKTMDICPSRLNVQQVKNISVDKPTSNCDTASKGSSNNNKLNRTADIGTRRRRIPQFKSTSVDHPRINKEHSPTESPTDSTSNVRVTRGTDRHADHELPHDQTGTNKEDMCKASSKPNNVPAVHDIVTHMVHKRKDVLADHINNQNSVSQTSSDDSRPNEPRGGKYWDERLVTTSVNLATNKQHVVSTVASTCNGLNEMVTACISSIPNLAHATNDTNAIQLTENRSSPKVSSSQDTTHHENGLQESDNVYIAHVSTADDDTQKQHVINTSGTVTVQTQESSAVRTCTSMVPSGSITPLYCSDNYTCATTTSSSRVLPEPTSKKPTEDSSFKSDIYCGIVASMSDTTVATDTDRGTDKQSNSDDYTGIDVKPCPVSLNRTANLARSYNNAGAMSACANISECSHAVHTVLSDPVDVTPNSHEFGKKTDDMCVMAASYQTSEANQRSLSSCLDNHEFIQRIKRMNDRFSSPNRNVDLDVQRQALDFSKSKVATNLKYPKPIDSDPKRIEKDSRHIRINPNEIVNVPLNLTHSTVLKSESTNYPRNTHTRQCQSPTKDSGNTICNTAHTTRPLLPSDVLHIPDTYEPDTVNLTVANANRSISRNPAVVASTVSLAQMFNKSDRHTNHDMDEGVTHATVVCIPSESKQVDTVTRTSVSNTSTIYTGAQHETTSPYVTQNPPLMSLLQYRFPLPAQSPIHSPTPSSYYTVLPKQNDTNECVETTPTKLSGIFPVTSKPISSYQATHTQHPITSVSVYDHSETTHVSKEAEGVLTLFTNSDTASIDESNGASTGANKKKVDADTAKRLQAFLLKSLSTVKKHNLFGTRKNNSTVAESSTMDNIAAVNVKIPPTYDSNYIIPTIVADIDNSVENPTVKYSDYEAVSQTCFQSPLRNIEFLSNSPTKSQAPKQTNDDNQYVASLNDKILPRHQMTHNVIRRSECPLLRQYLMNTVTAKESMIIEKSPLLQEHEEVKQNIGKPEKEFIEILSVQHSEPIYEHEEIKQKSGTSVHGSLEVLGVHNSEPIYEHEEVKQNHWTSVQGSVEILNLQNSEPKYEQEELNLDRGTSVQGSVEILSLQNSERMYEHEELKQNPGTSVQGSLEILSLQYSEPKYEHEKLNYDPGSPVQGSVEILSLHNSEPIYEHEELKLNPGTSVQGSLEMLSVQNSEPNYEHEEVKQKSETSVHGSLEVLGVHNSEPIYEHEEVKQNPVTSIQGSVEILSLQNYEPKYDQEELNLDRGTSVQGSVEILSLQYSEPKYEHEELNHDRGTPIQGSVEILSLHNSEPMYEYEELKQNPGTSVQGSLEMLSVQHSEPNYEHKELKQKSGTSIYENEELKQNPGTSAQGSLEILSLQHSEPKYEHEELNHDQGSVEISLQNSEPMCKHEELKQNPGTSVQGSLEILSLQHSEPKYEHEELNHDQGSVEMSLQNSEPMYEHEELKQNPGTSAQGSLELLSLQHSEPKYEHEELNHDQGSVEISLQNSEPMCKHEELKQNPGKSVQGSLEILSIENSEPIYEHEELTQRSGISIQRSSEIVSVRNSEPIYEHEELKQNPGTSAQGSLEILSLQHSEPKYEHEELNHDQGSVEMSLQNSEPMYEHEELKQNPGTSAQGSLELLSLQHSEPKYEHEELNHDQGSVEISLQNSEPMCKHEELKQNPGTSVQGSLEILSIENSEPIYEHEELTQRSGISIQRSSEIVSVRNSEPIYEHEELKQNPGTSAQGSLEILSLQHSEPKYEHEELNHDQGSVEMSLQNSEPMYEHEELKQNPGTSVQGSLEILSLQHSEPKYEHEELNHDLGTSVQGSVEILSLQQCEPMYEHEEIKQNPGTSVQGSLEILSIENSEPIYEHEELKQNPGTSVQGSIELLKIENSEPKYEHEELNHDPGTSVQGYVEILSLQNSEPMYEHEQKPGTTVHRSLEILSIENSEPIYEHEELTQRSGTSIQGSAEILSVHNAEQIYEHEELKQKSSTSLQGSLEVLSLRNSEPKYEHEELKQNPGTSVQGSLEILSVHNSEPIYEREELKLKSGTSVQGSLDVLGLENSEPICEREELKQNPGTSVLGSLEILSVQHSEPIYEHEEVKQKFGISIHGSPEILSVHNSEPIYEREELNEKSGTSILESLEVLNLQNAKPMYEHEEIKQNPGTLVLESVAVLSVQHSETMYEHEELKQSSSESVLESIEVLTCPGHTDDRDMQTKNERSFESMAKLNSDNILGTAVEDMPALCDETTSVDTVSSQSQHFPEPPHIYNEDSQETVIGGISVSSSEKHVSHSNSLSSPSATENLDIISTVKLHKRGCTRRTRNITQAAYISSSRQKMLSLRKFSRTVKSAKNTLKRKKHNDHQPIKYRAPSFKHSSVSPASEWTKDIINTDTCFENPDFSVLKEFSSIANIVANSNIDNITVEQILTSTEGVHSQTENLCKTIEPQTDMNGCSSGTPIGIYSTSPDIHDGEMSDCPDHSLNKFKPTETERVLYADRSVYQSPDMGESNIYKHAGNNSNELELKQEDSNLCYNKPDISSNYGTHDIYSDINVLNDSPINEVPVVLRLKSEMSNETEHRNSLTEHSSDEVNIFQENVQANASPLMPVNDTIISDAIRSEIYVSEQICPCNGDKNNIVSLKEHLYHTGQANTVTHTNSTSDNISSEIHESNSDINVWHEPSIDRVSGVIHQESMHDDVHAVIPLQHTTRTESCRSEPSLVDQFDGYKRRENKIVSMNVEYTTRAIEATNTSTETNSTFGEIETSRSTESTISANTNLQSNVNEMNITSKTTSLVNDVSEINNVESDIYRHEQSDKIKESEENTKDISCTAKYNALTSASTNNNTELNGDTMTTYTTEQANSANTNFSEHGIDKRLIKQQSINEHRCQRTINGRDIFEQCPEIGLQTHSISNTINTLSRQEANSLSTAIAHDNTQGSTVTNDTHSSTKRISFKEIKKSLSLPQCMKDAEPTTSSDNSQVSHKHAPCGEVCETRNDIKAKCNQIEYEFDNFEMIPDEKPTIHAVNVSSMEPRVINRNSHKKVGTNSTDRKIQNVDCDRELSPRIKSFEEMVSKHSYRYANYNRLRARESREMKSNIGHQLNQTPTRRRYRVYSPSRICDERAQCNKREGPNIRADGTYRTGRGRTDICDKGLTEKTRQQLNSRIQHKSANYKSNPDNSKRYMKSESRPVSSTDKSLILRKKQMDRNIHGKVHSIQQHTELNDNNTNSCRSRSREPSVDSDFDATNYQVATDYPPPVRPLRMGQTHNFQTRGIGYFQWGRKYGKRKHKTLPKRDNNVNNDGHTAHGLRLIREDLPEIDAAALTHGLTIAKHLTEIQRLVQQSQENYIPKRTRPIISELERIWSNPNPGKRQRTAKRNNEQQLLLSLKESFNNGEQARLTLNGLKLHTLRNQNMLLQCGVKRNTNVVEKCLVDQLHEPFHTSKREPNRGISTAVSEFETDTIRLLHTLTHQDNATPPRSRVCDHTCVDGMSSVDCHLLSGIPIREPTPSTHNDATSYTRSIGSIVLDEKAARIALRDTEQRRRSHFKDRGSEAYTSFIEYGRSRNSTSKRRSLSPKHPEIKHRRLDPRRRLNSPRLNGDRDIRDHRHLRSQKCSQHTFPNRNKRRLDASPSSESNTNAVRRRAEYEPSKRRKLHERNHGEQYTNMRDRPERSRRQNRDRHHDNTRHRSANTYEQVNSGHSSSGKRWDHNVNQTARKLQPKYHHKSQMVTNVSDCNKEKAIIKCDPSNKHASGSDKQYTTVDNGNKKCHHRNSPERIKTNVKGNCKNNNDMLTLLTKNTSSSKTHNTAIQEGRADRHSSTTHTNDNASHSDVAICERNLIQINTTKDLNNGRDRKERNDSRNRFQRNYNESSNDPVKSITDNYTEHSSSKLFNKPKETSTAKQIPVIDCRSGSNIVTNARESHTNYRQERSSEHRNVEHKMAIHTPKWLQRLKATATHLPSHTSNINPTEQTLEQRVKTHIQQVVKQTQVILNTVNAKSNAHVPNTVVDTSLKPGVNATDGIIPRANNGTVHRDTDQHNSDMTGEHIIPIITRVSLRNGHVVGSQITKQPGCCYPYPSANLR